MNLFNRTTVARTRQRSLFVGLVLLAALACLSTSVVAQDKQTTSWKVPEANAQYTQRLNIEVGDVPGHVVRIYEIHRTFGEQAPVFAGTRAAEAWDRGQAEYVNLNGPSWGYTIFQMVNGEKVFARFSGVVQTVIASDGTKQTTYRGTTLLTGGTGKFKGIRGVFHEMEIVDIASGRTETSVSGEYWFEK